MEKTEKILQQYSKIYVGYINHLPIHPNIKSFLTRKEFFNKDSAQYLYYPKLFNNPFQVQEDRNFELLCIAGFLYFNSLIIIDKSYDTKLKAISMSNFSTMLLCQEEAIKILSHLFDIHSPFWELWNLRKQEHFSTMESEKSFGINKELDFRELADLKSAFGKVAIDALYVLSKVKNKDKIRLKLLKAHKEFSWANQILDDLQDLEEDIEQNQPNVVYFLLQKKLADNELDIKSVPIVQLKKYLYSSGLATSLYIKAGKFYTNVREQACLLKLGVWEATLNELESDVLLKVEMIRGYFKSISVRKRLNVRSRQIQKLDFLPLKREDFGNELVEWSHPAFNYVLSEASSGFAELKHIMYLSKTEGFLNKRSIHIGDIFQRALMACFFCEVKGRVDLDLDKKIQSEVQYLMRKRLKKSIGGWSYFPTVKEIAPDIDDLGQIIQLLVKSNNMRYYDKYCKSLVNIVLNNYVDSQGGIKTWIIRKNGRNEIEEKQLFFNKTKWGEGPDIEVMANFLYSLTLLNKNEFDTCIIKGAKYILKHQDKRGFWESRWYYGNYYGTFVCLRFLGAMSCKVRYGKNAINALNYILNNQNSDGGWGVITNKSDPLNSALAILSLRFFEENGEEPIKKGFNYLYKNRLKDNTWGAVDFIRPRMNEPYKSKTITNMYVLKALFTLNQSLLEDTDTA